MDEAKRVSIFGVTGFVGRGLPEAFAKHGWASIGHSRGGGIPGLADMRPVENPDFRGISAVVNLAGEPVNQRWTPEVRRRIVASREDFTRRLVSAMAAMPQSERPRVLVNASAVGYYGSRGEELLREDSSPGLGFLADVCQAWEREALRAEVLGVRVVCIRIGIVLGAQGGALARMLPIFRLGLGGNLGDGQQWMPWIHVDDLRQLMIRAVEDPALGGPINAVAPHPVRNANFTREIAAVLGRPAFFHVPGFALRLALGGFGQELLSSMHVVPGVLTDAGFTFRHPELGPALRDLSKKSENCRKELANRKSGF